MEKAKKNEREVTNQLPETELEKVTGGAKYQMYDRNDGNKKEDNGQRFVQKNEQS